jgi:hypothetical protein
MADQAEPLMDPREHPIFLEDQASVENALAHARRFATKEPFKDRKEAGEAVDAIKALSNVQRDAEQRKLEITAPWRATTSIFNVHYKELLSSVEAAKSALKQKGLAFKREEDAQIAERRRQERAALDHKAEEAAKEAQAAAELAAEDPGDAEMQELANEARREAAARAVAPPVPIPDAPKQVRGGFSSLGSRTVYKHEVTDAAAVPERNKVISDASLKADIAAERAAAKAENRPFNLNLIPGVRIFPEEIPVSR